jgi:hypothetical protein
LFINQQQLILFQVLEWAQPLRKQWEKRQLFIKPTYKIKNNLKYIESELFAFNPDYPIIQTYKESMKHPNNIIITNFKYSTGGKDLNRIIFTANHTEDDLNAVIRILNQYQF